jgi:flagellar basal body-associated protein FliL
VGKLLKNKKLLIVIVVVVLGGGFAAKTFLLKPPPVDEKKLAKQEGTIFTIPEEFVVNLAPGQDGISHFARATVALGVSKLSASKIPASAEGATTPPSIEGQAKIQDLIRDALSSRTRDELLTKSGRDDVKETIVKLVNRDTDLKIVEVYLPKFAVQ